jgi:hypothetical protein
MTAGQEIRHFTVTVPAGTPQAAPFTEAITFPPRKVIRVYWRVPNGAMGVMGWNLSMGGVLVIPYASDQWVVANDEHDTWTATGQPESGAWQVSGYNTGTHPHSVYLAFTLEPISVPDTAAPAPLAPWAYTGPDLSKAGRPVAGQP